jgi:argininosuccinate lyase
MSKEKPWGGRFKEETKTEVEEFTSSIRFDKRLYKYDLLGSIAHAEMLAKQGIIKKEESRKIVRGLRKIGQEIETGKFPFRAYLEDIHMNIESRLIEKIGAVGGKLHTARSRNDQVALDIRLYLRDEIKQIESLVKNLQSSLLKKAEENIDAIMPGYTHLQRAQPVLFSHYLLAYFDMFERDRERLSACLERMNVCPLGAGALSGTGFPIDREFVAGRLGFKRVSENSIDSVSDRDFAIEFASASAVLMMHLSRLSEEIVLWSSQEFNFLVLPDSFTTGSSIMPQKKNPDVPELVRGKAGRVYGNLVGLLTMMKSLPLSYNRDMQEDKELLFDTVDTVKGSLTIYSLLIKGLRIDRKRMLEAAREGFITATDMADYLVRKGVPFRKAHEMVGKIVRFAIDRGKGLEEIPLQRLKQFSDLIGSDIYKYLSPEKSVELKSSTGGTSKRNVINRIRSLKRRWG